MATFSGDVQYTQVMGHLTTPVSYGPLYAYWSLLQVVVIRAMSLGAQDAKRQLSYIGSFPGT